MAEFSDNQDINKYDTVTEAIRALAGQGYITDFNIKPDKNCIICTKNIIHLCPEEFEIDSVYRFEGITDPADEMVLYAVSSVQRGVMGIVLSAYGMYAESDAAISLKFRSKTIA